MKKLVLVSTSPKENMVVYAFTGSEQSQHIVIFVVKHPLRGFLAITQYREKCKVIGFLQGRYPDADIDSIMGLPEMEHESNPNFEDEARAVQLANRVANLVSA